MKVAAIGETARERVFPGGPFVEATCFQAITILHVFPWEMPVSARDFCFQSKKTWGRMVLGQVMDSSTKSNGFSRVERDRSYWTVIDRD